MSVASAMNTKTPDSSKATSSKEASKSRRQTRLAASLRANLQKRKVQALRRKKKPGSTYKL
tara:strand:+ start:151 stop:333 length:183 start_codon:yes stop_codon:yes gene_type:complete